MDLGLRGGKLVPGGGPVRRCGLSGSMHSCSGGPGSPSGLTSPAQKTELCLGDPTSQAHSWDHSPSPGSWPLASSSGGSQDAASPLLPPAWAAAVQPHGTRLPGSPWVATAVGLNSPELPRRGPQGSRRAESPTVPTPRGAGWTWYLCLVPRAQTYTVPDAGHRLRLF